MRELTPRIALELMAHEGIVTEAYRDSVGVWTWSVGITDASGHRVFPRYKDQPQPLEHCIGVYLWLLREKYLPPVLAAFGGHDPSEAELAAALSFHWNTGAIGRASWIRKFAGGDVAGARKAMLDWARPASLLGRRRKEQALFFDGKWSEDGTALVYDVAKPSYRPKGGKRVPVRALVEGLFAGEPARKTWFDRLFR
ncbi:hypothetical protein OVA07_06565 [Novosphingobium sp. SL115]|uniref:lysozyme n=1 Tax=Novosphingobium sp. SL115 TaxID=2995150 RepID=UPI002273BDB0|nr:hypothetical protein [Novosphingobium sp. SL115]MCY1670675.1 hypothetical protein [Novosphingobium sp. SL115]